MDRFQNFATYPSLSDKNVVVTGGASGIGASLVEHFVHQGAHVAFLDLAEEAGRALVETLGMSGAKHAPVFYRCDVTDTAALQATLGQISRDLGGGGVHVLVNNAANDNRHSYRELSEAGWDGAMAVNLRHQFFAIQAVAPGMKESGRGSIVNMSSICWMIPSTGMPAYVTAKAAIVGLTRTMAHELGEWNIRVNAVLPGAILTERQKRLWWTPQYEDEIVTNQALKRHLHEDEVARLVLFLAADDSSAITNQSYIVDGGWA